MTESSTLTSSLLSKNLKEEGCSPVIPQESFWQPEEGSGNQKVCIQSAYEADQVNELIEDASETTREALLPKCMTQEPYPLLDELSVPVEYKKLKLANGGYSLVDADLYEELISYTWRKYDNGNGNIYVSRYDAVLKRNVYLHRQIMGASKDECVDHKNHISIDNRRVNLRLTDHKGNSRNRKKSKKYGNRKTSSCYKGVTWDKSRSLWQAHIRVDGSLKNLGRFEKESDGAKAYDTAAIEYFGEFANTNFEYNEPLFLEETL